MSRGLANAQTLKNLDSGNFPIPWVLLRIASQFIPCLKSTTMLRAFIMPVLIPSMMDCNRSIISISTSETISKNESTTAFFRVITEYFVPCIAGFICEKLLDITISIPKIFTFNINDFCPDFGGHCYCDICVTIYPGLFAGAPCTPACYAAGVPGACYPTISLLGGIVQTWYDLSSASIWMPSMLVICCVVVLHVLWKQ